MGDTEAPGEILCPVKSINLLAAQNPEETIRSQSPKGTAQSSSSATTDQPVIDPTTSEALFRNLKNAKRFAIDIGGSLTKIAYFSTVSHRRIRRKSKAGSVASSSPNNSLCSDPNHSANDERGDKENAASSSASPNNGHQDEFDYEVWEGARLHFIKFETLFIEECLDFIRKHLAPSISTSPGEGEVNNGSGDGWISGKYIKATGL
jgi:hypothetical protein